MLGGGIAGTGFARRMLSLAASREAPVKITLISRPSCNYCGGLITNLSLDTLRRIYDFEVPEDVVVSQIDEVVLVNRSGSASVCLESPLASVFRTSRFGQLGFDDSFRTSILSDLPTSAGEMLSVVEPAVATAVELPGEGRQGKVTYSHQSGTETLEADLIVIATGLRSIRGKLVTCLSGATGYRPPPTMPACVTEIDSSACGTSRVGRRLLILSGIVRGAVVAVIPKHRDWLTVAALGKVLTVEDLEQMFAHPAVREHVELDDVEAGLVCKNVCASGVYTGPAANFYGDGWVVVGDLTGHGRLLKDGYFAALLGANLAAHTCFEHGWSRQAFARHYHGGLRGFGLENLMAMELFGLNSFMSRYKAYDRVMMSAFTREGRPHVYGGLAHSAFRALSTGELPYPKIVLLFAAGMASWALKHPGRALAAALRKE